MIVDTTQTNEFGLPLVRGPYPSLGSAKEAIGAAREEGPVESPLAERIGKASPTATPGMPRNSKGAKGAAKSTEPVGAPEPPSPAEPPRPPEPKWIRDLRPGDRRKAAALIERLEGLGVPPGQAETVARAEVAQGLPGVARMAIEHRILAATEGADDIIAAVVDAMIAGGDSDLGVSWRLVDDRGRPIEKLDLDR